MRIKAHFSIIRKSKDLTEEPLISLRRYSLAEDPSKKEYSIKKDKSIVSREPGYNTLAWILDNPKTNDYLHKRLSKATCSFDVPPMHRALFIDQELVADEDELGATGGGLRGDDLSTNPTAPRKYPSLNLGEGENRLRTSRGHLPSAALPPYQADLGQRTAAMEGTLHRLAHWMEQMARSNAERD